MALKFQYNKTYLQLLNRQLKVRENALPTLIAKESALRLEVKRARDEYVELQRQIEARQANLALMHRLWSEFPAGLVKISKVKVATRKVAGIKTPILDSVDFSLGEYSRFASPAWLPSGIEILKELGAFEIKKRLAEQKTAILEYARKKTTQKVNLYEKVQIPEFRESILKIKRFLEDEDNLAKSSQKILKARMAQAEAAS